MAVDMYTPMGPRETRASFAPGSGLLMLDDKNRVSQQGYGGFPSHGQRVPTPQRSPLRVDDGYAGDIPMGVPIGHPVAVGRLSAKRHLIPAALVMFCVIFLICWLTMGFEKDQVDPTTGEKKQVIDLLKVIYALLFSVAGAALVVLAMMGLEHLR